MSVKHGILALLRERPGYGYQLRAAFEETTGSTWPVNIGQVYTTLGRLERDGLVAKTGEDAEGHVVYEITSSGVTELDDWFARPITQSDRPRDELAMKLALAVTVPGVDVAALVQLQRNHAQTTLHSLTQRKLRATEPHLAWSLVLEAQIFQAEAEIRWLDHVEEQVCRRNG
ncbi:PadR family transcriptional regulator [Actinospica sp.]|jgi:DNA-binding PadR family transcriptional regulator|uniref:PadR family transcriptional regulator n=1 Tax=Actinospica sp. TaxID=1872142 RepID=UPI002D06ABB8|nr:PadR family transcriptional regulator [Actinospica sp.]HWG23551.1 PadR family transcriptional regulator [Actinospica sp.]